MKQMLTKKYYELSNFQLQVISSILFLGVAFGSYFTGYILTKFRRRTIVDQYLTLFPTMTEDESLFEIFNCEILKNELIIYINFNYNYVYFYCMLFGIISLAISIFTFIGMIFIINSILWINSEEKNKEIFEDNENEETELDEIKEEEGEEEEFTEEETEEKMIN